MREVEAKFRVHPPFELPQLVTGAVAGVGLPERRQLVASYYDTVDLRLAREGITLRHRTGDGEDGWQLKLPVSGAGPGVRDEHHVSGSPDAVPDRLLDLVRVWTRFAPLSPVAVLLTDRTALPLVGPAGEVLGELVDDAVEVRDGGHVAARFREIEVEDKGGGQGVLTDVGDVLRASGAVAGEFVPKLVRALGPRASAPPDPPPPSAVGPGDPARRAVEAMLRSYVRALMAADPGVRLGAEDSIHQLRVAARRLRSGLRTFLPLVDQEWAQSLRAELEWLGGAIAPARDGEVLLARLLHDIDEVPDRAVRGPVKARIQEHVGGDALRAHEQALEALRGDRYLHLVDRLVDAARFPRTTDAAEAPAAQVLPELVAGTWVRLRRRAARLRSTTATEGDYHRVRLAAKQARYAGEAVAPVLGKRARRFARQMEHVQEVLGEHQDAVVAASTLELLSRQPRSGPVAFSLGVLYARQLEAGARARAHFTDVWDKASRRRYRAWLPS